MQHFWRLVSLNIQDGAINKIRDIFNDSCLIDLEWLIFVRGHYNILKGIVKFL